MAKIESASCMCSGENCEDAIGCKNCAEIGLRLNKLLDEIMAIVTPSRRCILVDVEEGGIKNGN